MSKNKNDFPCDTPVVSQNSRNVTSRTSINPFYMANLSPDFNYRIIKAREDYLSTIHEKTMIFIENKIVDAIKNDGHEIIIENLRFPNDMVNELISTLRDNRVLFVQYKRSKNFITLNLSWFDYWLCMDFTIIEDINTLEGRLHNALRNKAISIYDKLIDNIPNEIIRRSSEGWIFLELKELYKYTIPLGILNEIKNFCNYYGLEYSHGTIRWCEILKQQENKLN